MFDTIPQPEEKNGSFDQAPLNRTPEYEGEGSKNPAKSAFGTPSMFLRPKRLSF